MAMRDGIGSVAHTSAHMLFRGDSFEVDAAAKTAKSRTRGGASLHRQRRACSSGPSISDRLDTSDVLYSDIVKGESIR